MRQGVHKFERSMCGLTFYRLHNKWYIRRRSSLTGRRVKTSKRFEKSRQSAAKLGVASKLAATVYKPLPPAWKLYDLYKKLTAVAIQLLHEDADEKAILTSLQQQLYNWGYRKEIQYPVIQSRKRSIALRTPEECARLEKAATTTKQREEKSSPAIRARAPENIRSIIILLPRRDDCLQRRNITSTRPRAPV